MSLLLKNGDILTEEQGRYVLIEKGYLGIKGDTVSYLAKEPPLEKYGSERDMSGCLLLPGLINGHTHAPMVLLRGLGSGLPLQKWLFDVIFPVEERLTKADMKAGTELALLEMLSSGTTSFTDMYMEPETTAQCVVESGMKANLCRPLQSFDPEEDPFKSFRMKEMLSLYNNFQGAGDGRLLVDFSVHAEYTCTEKMVRAAAEAAFSRGAGLHIHLSETDTEQENCVKKYGMTPAAWFGSLGAFEGRTYAAHCVAVTKEDIALLKEKNVTPVHCPSSNMKLGSGLAPIPAMLQQGLPAALGTDGAASNNNLNMWEEMHLASILHNGFHKDPTCMQPEQVVAMATKNGAALQGRSDTGSLQKGYKADITAIDMTRPHLIPSPDPISSLVYTAQGSDVVFTMVNGKILYDRGEFTTLDRERILYDVKAALKRLFC